MCLRDKAAGRVGERHMVIFGSVADWKLGKGGKLRRDQPTTGWNEWNRE